MLMISTKVSLDLIRTSTMEISSDFQPLTTFAEKSFILYFLRVLKAPLVQFQVFSVEPFQIFKFYENQGSKQQPVIGENLVVVKSVFSFLKLLMKNQKFSIGISTLLLTISIFAISALLVLLPCFLLFAVVIFVLSD